MLIKRIKDLYRKWFYKEKMTVHPKYNKGIQYAFSCDGKDYYKLNYEYEIYEDRATFMATFSNEMDMKVTKETLLAFADAILLCFNAKDGESLNISKAIQLVNELKYRAEWLFDIDSLYRFASVIYFDVNENIKSYDWEYNKIKMDSWKKKGNVIEYLLEKVLGKSNLELILSQTDLETYLSKLQSQILRQQKLIYSDQKAGRASEIHSWQSLTTLN